MSKPHFRIHSKYEHLGILSAVLLLIVSHLALQGPPMCFLLLALWIRTPRRHWQPRLVLGTGVISACMVSRWRRGPSGGSRLWRRAALLDGTVTADPRHGKPSRCEPQEIPRDSNRFQDTTFQGPRIMGQLHHLHFAFRLPGMIWYDCTVNSES